MSKRIVQATFRAALVGGVLAAFAAPLHAGVIVVDPAGGGDFTTLAAAIAAAAEGDTLLISPSAPCTSCPLGGGYVAGKSLTIAFDSSRGPASAHPLSGLTVDLLAAGQTVVLRGLHVNDTIWVNPNGGAVWIEDCAATGKKGDGSVGLGGCLAGGIPGRPGIQAWGCDNVVIVDCTLQGGPGDNAVFNETFPSLSKLATDGGPGLYAFDASVAVYGSTLTAGPGGSGQLCFESADGGPGLEASQTSRVLLADCTLSGGPPGGPPVGAPGPGLRCSANSSVELLDTTATAWPGGVDFDAPPGTLVSYTGLARRFKLSSPLREGGAGTLSLAGAQGDFVGFFWAFDGALTPKPGKSGWFLLGGSIVAGPSLIGSITDPGGEWLIPITAPSLPPALEALTFLLQAYFVHPGGATLSSGTAFTLLDASF